MRFYFFRCSPLDLWLNATLQKKGGGASIVPEKKNKCRRAYRIHFWVRKCGWFRLRQNLQPFTTKFRRTKELRQIAVGVKPQRDAAKLNLSSKSVWRDVYMILIRSITVICCMTFKCRARRDASFTGWGTSF